MVTDTTQKIVLAVVVVAIVAYVVYILYNRRKKEKENFTALSAGAVNNAGVLESQPYAMRHSIDDTSAPLVNYADIVSDGNDYTKDYEAQPALEERDGPMQRLNRIQGEELMPRVSTNVTPYNIDVANPSSHKYMVNTPRVTTGLKSKYKDYSLSSFIRGDIPIKMNPNIALIDKTVQGRDDLRLDGLFTPHFTELYDKYTGSSTKNLVSKVAGAGVGLDGGASGELVMDNY